MKGKHHPRPRLLLDAYTRGFKNFLGHVSAFAVLTIGAHPLAGLKPGINGHDLRNDIEGDNNGLMCVDSALPCCVLN
jgi:hypothetical protein